MRDYFIHPAQTNLELYAQAVSHGYGVDQRRTLAQAYQFALRQVYPLARGSGKPFIAHLVGTASLVLESGCPPNWVVGALLHAIYQRRVPFEGGLAPSDRRAAVSRRFNPEVDDIVFRYTAIESEDLQYLQSDSTLADIDVVTLRLADELEDLSGHALALHGTTDGDDAAVRGSYPQRRDIKISQAPALLALAESLGADGLRRGLQHWLDFSTVPSGLADMRTGWFSSVDLVAEGTLNANP